MSKTQISWLFALTIVAAVVLMLLPGKTGIESTFEVKPLVPGLDARVNDITRVRISRGGNIPVATLVRGEKGWQIEEAELYPADWPRLKSLLAALAQANVIELKTSNPEYMDRLGLVDIEREDSSALQLELGEGEGLIVLLVGNAAREREGQFVRFADTSQALLIDRPLDVGRETADWLERGIVDLAEAEVVEVDISHPDGEQIRIRKISADDTDFSLLDIPDGREIQSKWSVNALGGSLADLQLDEVKADTAIDWSQAVKLRALTADGVEVNAELASGDGVNWLRLSAAVYPAAGDEEAVTAPRNDESEPQAPASRKRVEEINHRTGGWAYSIPAYKAQLMNKRLEDLLAARKDS